MSGHACPTTHCLRGPNSLGSPDSLDCPHEPKFAAHRPKPSPTPCPQTGWLATAWSAKSESKASGIMQ
eukprot:4536755-Alexandrium_andersonii.AAC.1